MRFCLIDRITACEPGVRLLAIKNVTLSEEYLGDHFPKFPVLPGVFMLEALTQASAWLVRISDDFSHSIVTLKDARSVKFAGFVSPGSTLDVAVEIGKEDGREVHLKCQGWVDGRLAVSGKFVLERRNLAEDDPMMSHLDERVIRELRAIYEILAPGLAKPAAAESVAIA
jgi:3-hydroxyacyl-[acyl-carrier-protein] dehydratase